MTQQGVTGVTGCNCISLITWPPATLIDSRSVDTSIFLPWVILDGSHSAIH